MVHHTLLVLLVILSDCDVLFNWITCLAVALNRGMLRKELPPVFLKGTEFKRTRALVPSVKFMLNCRSLRFVLRKRKRRKEGSKGAKVAS